MKNLVFKVLHKNFGEIGPGDWDSTTFDIYDDYSVEISDNFNHKSCKLSVANIGEEDYKKILDIMEKIDSINKTAYAYDGDAWEFAYYKNDKIYKKRELDYIYGIEQLENIKNILEKLSK